MVYRRPLQYILLQYEELVHHVVIWQAAYGGSAPKPNPRNERYLAERVLVDLSHVLRTPLVQNDLAVK